MYKSGELWYGHKQKPFKMEEVQGGLELGNKVKVFLPNPLLKGLAVK